MNKLMGRYKGLFLSCVSVMMIVVCICSFSFESKAASYEFNMPYGQPTTSENSGYLEILVYDKAGFYFCDVFYWNITADNSSSVTSMDISVYGDGRVNFSPSVPSMNDAFSYTLMYIGSSGNVSYMHGGYFDGYASYTYDVSQYGYTFLSYRVYGNYGTVSDSVNKPMTQFTCFYGADKFELEKLSNIYNQLVVANANDTQMINKLNSIMNSNSSMDSKLSQLIELQKTTNTWLEKIWNSIQEFLSPNEEDKQASEELENETNDKTSQLDDLNEQNKTDKTDIDSASGSVDENVDLDSIDNYGGVLACITENEYILQILLLVFSVALVGYVLFGKR